MLKYICRALDIAFAHNLESDKHVVLLGCTPNEKGGYHFEDKVESDNPLEVWSIYIMRAYARLRRRIGDKLEAEGKSRYTGERKTQCS